MTLARRPSPFGELVTLRQAMDRLFDDTVFRPYQAGNGYADFGCVVREISRGSVMRTVALPTGLEADKAAATFEHGVLRLRFPRAEQVKYRQIRIQPVTTGEAKPIGAGGQPPKAGA